MRALTRSLVIVPLLALAAILIGLPTVAFGGDNGRTFSTRLIGFNETPASVNTDGSGTLRLTLNADSIDFELTYRNVRANPTQSHIHFGQARTSGGIAIFLCGPAGSPARQACPASTSGTVTGRITADEVTGPAGQGIPAQGLAPRDLAAMMRAIRGGAAYGNLHTTMFPGGEIRGQLRRGDLDDGNTDIGDAGDTGDTGDRKSN